MAASDNAQVPGTAGLENASGQAAIGAASLQTSSHRKDGRADRPTVVLVAPNVSRNMGGEALKALHIWQALESRGIDCVQVTHERVRSQVESEGLRGKAVFVDDSPLLLWLARRGRWAVFHIISAWRMNRAARKAADEAGAWLVHFTAPISTVLPYFRLRGWPTVIGPINGNIAYPPALREHETSKDRFRRVGAPIAQWILGALFSGKRHAAAILVAGGERTRISLRRGMVPEAKFIETLDSGVDDELAARPVFTHSGQCNRFVFVARLVELKGCHIAIRAIALTSNCELDVIGDGEERAKLEKLARDLGVEKRVRFLGWIPAGDAVFDAMSGSRALVLPTMTEANGIAFQEAMMLGLPIITLNWGGPQLLLDSATGILIDPAPIDELVLSFSSEIASLAADGERANRLAVNARKSAEAQGFAWSKLIGRWIDIYNKILEPTGLRIPKA